MEGTFRAETAVAIANEVFGTSLPKEAFAIENNALVDVLSIESVVALKKAPNLSKLKQVKEITIFDLF